MGLKLWAALSAALGLCATSAHSATLLYSASGVVSDSGSTVNAVVALPAGGYVQPTPIDPLTNPFRGDIFGSGGNYTVVLTTNASQVPNSVTTSDRFDLELWTSGAAYGINGWIPGGAGPLPLDFIYTPVISGDTYTWSIGTGFSQTINGCAPDSWSTCYSIQEMLQEPLGLEVNELFGSVDAGATWSLQIYADVPEPAEWSLMTLGIGLLGAGLRRRRASVAFLRTGFRQSLECGQ